MVRTVLSRRMSWSGRVRRRRSGRVRRRGRRRRWWWWFDLDNALAVRQNKKLLRILVPQKCIVIQAVCGGRWTSRSDGAVCPHTAVTTATASPLPTLWPPALFPRSRCLKVLNLMAMYSFYYKRCPYREFRGVFPVPAVRCRDGVLKYATTSSCQVSSSLLVTGYPIISHRRVGRSLWPLVCWDRGFESHRGHGCLLWVLCVVR